MSEEIDIASKHLKVLLLEKKPKTNEYGIYSKSDGWHLGVVKWHPAWRQYCFFPEPLCVWSKDCLRDLLNFVESENINHKNKRCIANE